MNVRPVGLSRLVVAAFACGAITAACSGAKSHNFDDTKSTKDRADGGAGVPDSSSIGVFAGDAGGGGSSSDASCAAKSTKAEGQPLDIFMMLDQSGSMADEGKWPAVTSALTTFFNQPSLTGVGVGLQYFPLLPAGACTPTCSPNGSCGAAASGPCVLGFCSGCVASGMGSGAPSCTTTDYSKPEVEIGALPGVAAALGQSIAAHGPAGGTPTSAALQGAVDHAKEWAVAHPGHVTIALLATDGEPAQCDVDLNHINAIAAAALAGTPKVLTFVIGVGSSIPALNGIAAAGGTGTAFIADTAGNVNQQFLDALNKIRGQALGCTYQVPLPMVAGTLDFGSVNVQYTPAGAPMPTTIPKVTDKAACPASGDAWYYDDNAAPKQIVLCDASCKTVGIDVTGELNIAVGCSTVLR